MASKRLSEKQSDRIAKREQAIIETYTRDNDSYAKGLVVGSFGHDVVIEDPSGNRFQCKVHRDRTRPVCGDDVLWLPGTAGQGIIEAVLPCHSLLERPDNRGNMRRVAANIDCIIIVVAPVPEFNEGLLDRYLVAASKINVEPVIVINKIDLLDQDALHGMEKRLSIYESLGYTVVKCSAGKNLGIDSLNMALSGRTCILVGQSGVGKSSLVNRLLPGADVLTNSVSTATGKGKHTTTSARLYHLPCGGRLIDSPGIREFGLTHASPAEVEQAYAEIHAAAANCQFNNCTHRNEPGCAVQAAIDNGEIDAGRFERYQRILDSIAS